MLLNCGVGEDSWESLELQGDQTSQSETKSVLNIRWKDWCCWSWNSNTLATWCEGLTHLKRHWCWERLKAGGKGDDRGWDGWMPSLTLWTWVWVSSWSWWRTGEPGMLQAMGSQRVGRNWATELNWAAVKHKITSNLPSPCSDNLLHNVGLSCIYSVDFVRKRGKTKGKTKSVCNAPQTVNSPSESFKNYCAVCNYMFFLSHFFFSPISSCYRALNLTSSCHYLTVPYLNVSLPILQKLPTH